LTAADDTSAASFVVADWGQHQTLQRGACSVWNWTQWNHVWDRKLTSWVGHCQRRWGPEEHLYCLSSVC